jgi:predicted nucleotide-binding protein (sugar kinase/HSP70/actin superfamily)
MHELRVVSPAKPPSPTSSIDIERELAAHEAAERDRLGLRTARRQWVDQMIDPRFTRAEREHVTLLGSGLTCAQDFLIEGALRGVGYKIKSIGAPDNAALQAGKEYGNRAQCNPTYYTVGNLVKHLIKLRDEDGLSAEEIIAKYIFFTAGACGPCRFGMYATEYRKALRDAGFDGFRVLLFQQQGGFNQATGEDPGLDLNPAFFMALIKGVVCGDVLNALTYRIRPYEKVPGATNRAMVEAQKIVYEALLRRTNVFAALHRCRKVFAAVEIDRLRAKPRVSIIGEFWAMTTEGDGNYHLQHFLESEGAECDIQLTTAWLLYNIWQVARDTRVRSELRQPDSGKKGLDKHQGGLDVAKRLATLRFAEAALRFGFQLFAVPPGLHAYHLPDMEKIAEFADGHYSNDLRGGEGHMEVGKLIMNVVGKKAHMTLSVKPFGCMPSSGVSDGVQSLITGKYPGSIFCAVETSGDGATNFYSRVQMYMHKARIAAEAELARAFADSGVSRADVERFLADNPSYASPFHVPPHVVSGTAANLVYEVAPLITSSRRGRALTAARGLAKRAIDAAQALPAAVVSGASRLADPEVRGALAVDASVLYEAARGRLGAQLAPLLERLAGPAATDAPPDYANAAE